MEAIIDLFRRKAELFSSGDIDAACEEIALPTAIYSGENLVPVTDRQSMAEMLWKSRARLAKSGYDRTTFELSSTASYAEDMYSVGVKWYNITRSGEGLSVLTGRYYCTLENNRWSVALVEFDDQATVH